MTGGFCGTKATSSSTIVYLDMTVAFDRLSVKLLSEVIYGFLQFWLFSELCKIGVISIFLGEKCLFDFNH